MAQRMIAFRFSLEPWTDDRGQQLQAAAVGRQVDGTAVVVHLYHDPETDSFLYGYWGDGIFGKIFVVDSAQNAGGEPTWEVSFLGFRYEPARARIPSQAEQAACVARAVDALAQWPDGDLRLSIPGKAMRRIICR